MTSTLLAISGIVINENISSEKLQNLPYFVENIEKKLHFETFFCQFLKHLARTLCRAQTLKLEEYVYATYIICKTNVTVIFLEIFEELCLLLLCT